MMAGFSLKKELNKPASSAHKNNTAKIRNKLDISVQIFICPHLQNDVDRLFHFFLEV